MTPIPLDSLGPVEVLLVKTRTDEYFARVRWSDEIRIYTRSVSRTLYTECAPDAEAALALANIILATGRGLASSPPTG